MQWMEAGISNMRWVKKGFFLLLLCSPVYRLWVCIGELHALAVMDRQKDILASSKFVFTYGTEEEWRCYGAENVETSFEYGERFLFFPDYKAYYQIDDKHDDILGGVTEKRTGEEELTIEVSYGETCSLFSSELSRCDFRLYDLSCGIVGEDVRYRDGAATVAEGISVDRRLLEEGCEQLAACIGHFEETAARMYPQVYQEQWNERTEKMIRAVFWVFLCLAVWRISDSLGAVKMIAGPGADRKELSFAELTDRLTELGIGGITDEVVSRMEERYAKLPEHLIFDKTAALLVHAGYGGHRAESGGQSYSGGGVYCFDVGAFDRERMYTDFLNGISALGGEELMFTNIAEDLDGVDWAYGIGTRTVGFDWNGVRYTLTAAHRDGWFDSSVADQLNKIIIGQDTGKRLFFASGGEQV